jgi:hypothetical protein
MGSLADDLTDADAEGWIAAAGLSPANLPTVTGKSLNKFLRPSVFRAMWRSQRGQDWARKLAFRDVSFADHIRAPMFLYGMEMLHQAALPPGPLTREQDELLWQLVQDVYQAYLARQLTEKHLVMVGLVAEGIPHLPGLGWKELSASLVPPLQGSVAYLFGQRYLRLNKREEAAGFFRDALSVAPPKGSLRDLTQAELDRLKP